MTAVGALDSFDIFRPVAWLARGMLTNAETPKNSAFKTRIKATRGLNLLAFFQARFGAGSRVQSGERQANQPPYIQYFARTLVRTIHTSAEGFNAKVGLIGTTVLLPGQETGVVIDSEISGGLGQSKSLTSNVSQVAGLNPATKKAIGQHGVSRLMSFLELPSGWDSGHGNPLNAGSLMNFDAFMRLTSFAPPAPSVFMTTEGNLILNWLGPAGKVTELEFGLEEISAYDEDSGEENIFQHDQLTDLKQFLLRSSVQKFPA